MFVLILALSSESAESCARRCWCIETGALMGIPAQRGMADGGERKMQRLEGWRGAGYGGTAARKMAIMVDRLLKRRERGGRTRRREQRKGLNVKILHRN